ncbi:MAG: hypothetical protein KDK48_06925, partial [Chlamydiia bacterium]|nr:hypothetical protein [Chlamydiia bacterium]
LSYAHPDKQVAEGVLDALMQSYQGYLSAESERQGELQLGYLLKRQQEMFASQEALMRQHAECLFKESNPSGFVEASREIEFLTKARMQALEKTHALDGQIRYLTSYKLQEAGSHPPLPTLAKCFEELAHMKLERDALAQAVAHTNDKDAIEPDEFQGINLEAAKKLHMAYIQEAEERSAGIRKLGFILQQLEEPTFEINSLSSSLPDPICQEIIAKSGQIALRLRDEKNYAPREVERLNGELLTQRRFLQAHLAQAKSLEQLKIDLLSKKSRAVKVAMVDLCNEQIALLQKHVEDAVASEVQTLKRQKEQIAAYMGDLSSSLAALPEKWISEQLVSQNLALSRASF